jgi:hypothetical protein
MLLDKLPVLRLDKSPNGNIMRLFLARSGVLPTGRGVVGLDGQIIDVSRHYASTSKLLLILMQLTDGPIIGPL